LNSLGASPHPPKVEQAPSHDSLLQALPREPLLERRRNSVSETGLSIVIPVYQAEAILPELHQRLVAVLEEHYAEPFELVFVDDRSPQGDWEVLGTLAAGDPRVRALRLSRNFGQHAAITAGLAAARGALVIVMDCDLQDPPEDIPRLLEKAAEGYLVVYGRRVSKAAALHRRLAAKLYFKLLEAFTGQELDGSYGTFSLIARPVVDAFLGIKDRDRHYLLVLRWLGFRSTSIEYRQLPRGSGESSYTLGKLVEHAINGLFFHSTRLLRWIAISGFFISCAGAGLALYYALLSFMTEQLPGWTTIVIIQLLLGGFILSAVGVAGLYIGKVFEQVKGRPIYLIEERLGPCAGNEARGGELQ